MGILANPSSGFSIPLEWALYIKGLLLGLRDMNDDTLALGLVEDYEEERF
jgi:hypothetical protein